MQITDALLGEHAVFYGLFDRLAALLSAGSGPAELKAAAGLLGPTLASHARLEEELLFTALVPHLGNAGPLQVMRMEHDEIDRLVGRLALAEGLPAIGSLLHSLIEIARHHFAKEEQVLFPAAVQVLDPALLVRLGAQWAERRAVHL